MQEQQQQQAIARGLGLICKLVHINMYVCRLSSGFVGRHYTTNGRL